MTRLAGLDQELQRNRKRLLVAANGRANVDDVIDGVLAMVAESPRLQECSPASIVQAVIKGLTLGIDPTGVSGEGYITPRKGRAVFVPGYRGLLVYELTKDYHDGR